jgi:hypothetical protein
MCASNNTSPGKALETSDWRVAERIYAEGAIDLGQENRQVRVMKTIALSDYNLWIESLRYPVCFSWKVL